MSKPTMWDTGGNEMDNFDEKVECKCDSGPGEHMLNKA